MTDDDRRLLERAARAAGYVPARLTDDGTALLLEGLQRPWNSLADNNDAFRLQCLLEIETEFDCGAAYAHNNQGGTAMYLIAGFGGAEAAARRAITRAAAEMAP